MQEPIPCALEYLVPSAGPCHYYRLMDPPAQWSCERATKSNHRLLFPSPQQLTFLMVCPPTQPTLANSYFGQMTLSFLKANAGLPPQGFGLC
jgi:hypothetical protein